MDCIALAFANSFENRMCFVLMSIRGLKSVLRDEREEEVERFHTHATCRNARLAVPKYGDCASSSYHHRGRFISGKPESCLGHYWLNQDPCTITLARRDNVKKFRCLIRNKKKKNNILSFKNISNFFQHIHNATHIYASLLNN